MSDKHDYYEIGDKVTGPDGQTLTIVGKLPPPRSVHWMGDAIPRDLRAGDRWNGALILEVTDDSITAELPIRIPSFGDDDED